MFNVRYIVKAVIATLTLLAAASAAYFTYKQASVALDHERRALRAYVVVGVKLVESEDPKSLLVEFTAENMGQTPVYNLYFDVLAELIEYDPTHVLRHTECRSGSRLEKQVGKTFATAHSANFDIFGRWNTSKDALYAAMIEERKVLVALGTVCYRDIFGEMHTTSVCYWWNDPETDAFKCGNYNEIYD